MMYNVKIHLTDECNIRCKDCHWFTHDVSNGKIIDAKDYISWINKNYSNISVLTISGGEPTLHPQFIEIVNNIPLNIRLRINTNGTNLDILKQITRKHPTLLHIGKNRKTKESFEDDIKSLGIRYQIVSYTGFDSDKKLSNQVEDAKSEDLISILGKKCFCSPNHDIRFGSDGWAYNCEIGLTEKAEYLRTGVSLWNDIIVSGGMECSIKPNCLSSFCGGENSYRLL